MDIVANIRTFLSVARLGSFSAAAREAGTVPSVIAKRISQLEHRVKTTLFLRSTRGLQLTGSGYSYHQRFMVMLADLEAALDGVPGAVQPQERIRIKSPITMSDPPIDELLIDFRLRHPGVRIELVLIDRSLNPLEEGYDMAIGALPASFPHVIDVPLRPLRRKCVAAPEYLSRRGRPTHPRELSGHDCITFPLSGTTWIFEGTSGEVAVDVSSVFSAADGRVLCSAAVRGVGVTIVAEHLARPALAAGALVEVLPDFRVPALYMKVMVPESRQSSPAIRALIETLVAASLDVPPGSP